MQEWLGNNDILIYSLHVEGKSVVTKRFIKTLKAFKIYKKMTSNEKLPSLKLVIESELLIIRIFLVKVTLKIGQEKYLLLILFSELILRLKVKDLKREKIIGSFYEK